MLALDFSVTEEEESRILGVRIEFKSDYHIKLNSIASEALWSIPSSLVQVHHQILKYIKLNLNFITI